MFERYVRQTPVIGLDGQNKLKESVVLVIGCGGIGNSLLVNLVSMGVGKLIFYDHDRVCESNLHRQILFGEADLGSRKVDVVHQELRNKNSESILEGVSRAFNNDSSCHEHIKEADLVIDGTDNYDSMYFINDICAFYGKKLISSSILKSSVQIVCCDTSVACYRCLFPEPPPAGLIPNCASGGVLGGVAGTAGTLSSVLAVNLLLGMGEEMLQRLLVFNANDFSSRKLPIEKNNNCAACVDKKILVPLFDEYSLTLEQLKNEDYFLVDVREQHERDNFKLKDDIHIPLRDVVYDASTFPKKKVVFYCHTTNRSKIATKKARENGIDAYYLFGGASEHMKE